MGINVVGVRVGALPEPQRALQQHCDPHRLPGAAPLRAGGPALRDLLRGEACVRVPLAGEVRAPVLRGLRAGLPHCPRQLQPHARDRLSRGLRLPARGEQGQGAAGVLAAAAEQVRAVLARGQAPLQGPERALLRYSRMPGPHDRRAGPAAADLPGLRQLALLPLPRALARRAWPAPRRSDLDFRRYVQRVEAKDCPALRRQDREERGLQPHDLLALRPRVSAGSAAAGYSRRHYKWYRPARLSRGPVRGAQERGHGRTVSGGRSEGARPAPPAAARCRLVRRGRTTRSAVSDLLGPAFPGKRDIRGSRISLARIAVNVITVLLATLALPVSLLLIIGMLILEGIRSL